ncbi:hypothetical protein [Pseudomonas orientalis]|uniref:hypothetical protein n=1 Tax=Pseudomonas orientalis TaxID=76758 RepID=UPI002FDF2F96
METPHRLARSLRQIITQVQSPSVFVGKDLILLTKGTGGSARFLQQPVRIYIGLLQKLAE